MRRTLLKAMCTGQWSRYELWLGLRMVGMLLLLPLLQRALTLPTLLHLLDARTVSPARITVSRLCALLDGVLQQHSALLRPTCVKKSLILFHHLRRWGYPVQIHFGVVKHGSVLAGHCWLELDGQPLAEPADPQQAFTVAYSYSGHAPASPRD